jgi:hypothetical protein
MNNELESNWKEVVVKDQQKDDCNLVITHSFYALQVYKA